MKDYGEELGKNTKLVCLDIPDRFGYRDEGLIEMIKLNYKKVNDA